jgi:hypothetical protein
VCRLSSPERKDELEMACDSLTDESALGWLPLFSISSARKMRSKRALIEWSST